jgi:hypothetical protein
MVLVCLLCGGGGGEVVRSLFVSECGWMGGGDERMHDFIFEI